MKAAGPDEADDDDDDDDGDDAGDYDDDDADGDDGGDDGTDGENDDIVPCVKSLEAKDFLERNKVSVELEIIKNCGHHIPIEASSIGLKFIKKIFDLN